MKNPTSLQRTALAASLLALASASALAGDGLASLAYAGGEALAPEHEARLLSMTTTPGGSLTRDEVDRVIRRHLSQIGYCYEKELQRSPIMGGKLVSQFTSGPTGQVVAVDVAEDSLGSDVVTACVSGVIRRMRFPAPRGGSTVEVNYPFVFQSAGN